MIPIISTVYPKIIIPLIDNAKTNIDILMYQWGYYPHKSQSEMQKINYAIKSAIIRGVKVRVLIHPGTASDPIASKNSETVSHLKTWGAEIKYGTKPGLHHAKMVLIDLSFAAIGSHNFSLKAMTANVEIGVVVEGAGEVRKFQEYFDILWSQS